ncbi:uncharacterized protein YALI1_F16735g [Yarrowia lipolytica]|uniref:Uncharacterized protein n=1 Tax=Yarrowia lipolytica TaxID=4952 RepID=A0A1D8NN65_YARLL|nr:hypothetical protein YALI1_F16735g [Yarrowia lipolytica]
MLCLPLGKGTVVEKAHTVSESLAVGTVCAMMWCGQQILTSHCNDWAFRSGRYRYENSMPFVTPLGVT